MFTIEINYNLKIKKAIRKMYQMKIYDNDKEYVGLLFFGTENTNTGEEHNDFQYIYEVHSLKEPSAERIKELDKFTTDLNIKKFQNEYGHSDQYSLHKVFWYCSNMFSSADKKLGLKRILLFTDNSHPHRNNIDYQRLAKNKAKDLIDIGIQLDVVPLSKRGETFDFSEFYADVLMLPIDSVSKISDSSDSFDEIMLSVREKVHKKRPYTHLNLNLSDECSISCSVFNLVRECPKPTKIKLDKKNNVETTTITHRYAPDTGEVLFDSDTKLAIDVCDKRVAFEQDEVKAIKKFGLTGMKLLGFKSISCLKPYMYVKPGHFLYPGNTYSKR
jgi:ATP-dependent DNA helicase 2 subunit 1